MEGRRGEVYINIFLQEVELCDVAQWLVEGTFIDKAKTLGFKVGPANKIERSFHSLAKGFYTI